MQHADFAQSLLAQSLLAPDVAPPASLTSFNASDPVHRFGVYRNNVVVSLIEGLAAKFPVVSALVGDDFFKEMARHYAVAHPPRSRIMAEYGDDFSKFVAGFQPAQSVPYLADVAQLEAHRVQAYHAQDALACEPDAFAHIPQEKLFDVTVNLHPSLALLTSNYAIFSLWAAHQGAREIETVDPNEPEDVLIIRPEFDVETILLPTGCYTFLCALQTGSPLGEAASQALQQHQQFDLTQAFQILVTNRIVTTLYED